MGNTLSSCPCRRNRVTAMKEITLLMIGLDNAGKTCTTKHLLGEPTCDGVPTVGFTSVKLKHGKYNVCIYDIGGGPKIRGIWKNYYALIHGLIFVVDASDSQRLEECKHEINKVLKDDRIAGKPMLLLFNKQDLGSVVNETELVGQLDLEALVNEQQCPTRVEASCAIYDQNKIKDPGIQEGFSWLIGHIAKEFSTLSERVEREKDIQMKQEQQERELRMERVRKIREEREKREQELNPECSPKNNDDDDKEVIIEDPFKPANVIREELEEKEKLKKIKREIVLIPSRSEQNSDLLTLSSQDILQDANTNHSLVEAFKSSKSEEDIRVEKTKSKKPKKRFKNRIAPQSEMTELPPLKPHGDLVSNGMPQNGTLLHM